MSNLNELKVHINSTGIKLNTENLMINQNSSNNRLFLYTESDFRFVSVYFKRPDGTVMPEIHMIPAEFDKDWNSYVFYVDIPFSTTSFTMPNPTAQLAVSFIGYTKNSDEQFIPVSVANTQITVSRVDNTQVADYGYTTDEIANLWDKLGRIQSTVDEINIDELLNRAIASSAAINEINGNINTLTSKVVDTNQRYIELNASLIETQNNLAQSDINISNNATNISTLFGTTNSLNDSIQAISSNLIETYYSKSDVDNLLILKQDKLKDNVNIKTINNKSILGSGNLDLITKDDIKNYYTKQETNTQISNAISNLDIIEVVSALPSKGTEGKVYLVPKSTGNGNDVYDEYVWANNKWEFIKTSVIDIDLSEYYKATQVNNLFYNKTDVNGLLNNLHSTITSETQSSELSLKNELNENINNVDGKFVNYYNKSEVDTLKTNAINTSKAYTDTKLSDYYTATQIDTKLTTNYYTNTAVDEIISNYYTKAQVDTFFNVDLLTKNEFNTAIAAYDTIADVDAKIAAAKKSILTGDSNETLNEAYDTLLEVAQYISSDLEAASTMTNNIATNASEIQRVEQKVDNRIVCTFKQW